MVTNLKSKWVDGNLVFYDKDMNEILTFDGLNRKVSFPSGSALEVQSGGSLDVDSSEEINAPGLVKVAKVALGALDTGGGVLAWQNPEGAAIVIQRILLDVTTKATGACTIDVGTTATNATTSSDNLIDGKDIHTAAGVFDNFDDAGDNGKSKQRLASGKWVTGSKASGAAAGTVGFAYIEYVVI